MVPMEMISRVFLPLGQCVDPRPRQQFEMDFPCFAWQCSDVVQQVPVKFRSIPSPSKDGVQCLHKEAFPLAFYSGKAFLLRKGLPFLSNGLQLPVIFPVHQLHVFLGNVLREKRVQYSCLFLLELRLLPL